METRPLYVDFANSVLANRSAELASMDEAKKKETVLSVFRQASEMSELNIQQDVPKQEIESAKKLTAEGKGKWQRFGTTERAKSIGAEREKDINLRQSGVDVDRELPAGDWKLGFGINPTADVKKVLSDHYETNVPVFMSQGELLYIDPEKKRPVKVNLDIGAQAGKGLPVFGDIAGTVLGKSPQGFVMKAVAKETIGSGSGAAIGELVRLTVGQMAGVHDLTPDEIALQSAKVGGEASLWTGGIGTGVAGVKGIQNLRKGGIFTKDEAMKWGFSAEEADQLIAEVNEIIKRGGSNKEIKATLYQKTGDVDIGARQAQLERRSEYAKDFAEREVSDQSAAREGLEVLSRPEVAPLTGREGVEDIAASRVSKRVEQGKQIVNENAANLERQLDEMSKVQKETVGDQTVAFLQKKKDTVKAAEKKAWKDAETTGGYNEGTGRYGINIEEGANTKATKAKFKEESTEAWTDLVDTGITSIYKGGKEVKVSDLANINTELSRLRNMRRIASNNQNMSGTQLRDLNKVIKAMEADRKSALIKSGKSDLLQKIEDAEAATILFHEKYKRSVVGDLLAVNDKGVSKIKSEQFVDNMLGRDKAEVAEFMTLIGDNPELKALWKDGIVNAFQRKAFSNGRYSPRTGVEFIRQKRHVLKAAGFTNQEIKQFGKTGRLAEKVAKQKDQLKKFKDKVNTRWPSGKIASTSPMDMTKFITGGTGTWKTPSGVNIKNRLDKIQTVKNFTRNEPAAWQTIKNDFKRSIHDDIIDLKTGNIDANKLSTWVEDAGNEKVIKMVMGSKYYDDLMKLNKVVKMINLESRTLVADEGHKALIQGVRAAVAPPLTRRGRAFTAALTWDSRRSHRVMADAILDEKIMGDIAELSEHDKWSRIFFEKLASVGFNIPSTEFAE